MGSIPGDAMMARRLSIALLLSSVAFSTAIENSRPLLSMPTIITAITTVFWDCFGSRHPPHIGRRSLWKRGDKGPPVSFSFHHNQSRVVKKVRFSKTREPLLPRWEERAVGRMYTAAYILPFFSLFFSFLCNITKEKKKVVCSIKIDLGLTQVHRN